MTDKTLNDTPCTSGTIADWAGRHDISYNTAVVRFNKYVRGTAAVLDYRGRGRKGGGFLIDLELADSLLPDHMRRRAALRPAPPCPAAALRRDDCRIVMPPDAPARITVTELAKMMNWDRAATQAAIDRHASAARAGSPDRGLPAYYDTASVFRLLRRGGYKGAASPYSAHPRSKTASAAAGKRRCLKCAQDFHSPDRSRIRICNGCKATPEWRHGCGYSVTDCGGAVGQRGERPA